MKMIEIYESKESHYATNLNEFDRRYNPEANYYAEQEEAATKIKWEESGGNTPVVTKDVPQKDKWTTDAPVNTRQSPGYRGKQEALQRADIPHKKYQHYNPNFVARIDQDDMPEGMGH